MQELMRKAFKYTTPEKIKESMIKLLNKSYQASSLSHSVMMKVSIDCFSLE